MAGKTEYQDLYNLKLGDRKAFRSLYERHHRKVYGYSLRICGNYPIAEEITQDVFVRLWQKRASIIPSDSISPLLFKITKDLVWNYLRTNSRIKDQSRQFTERTLSSIKPTIETELLLEEYLTITDQAVRKLPPKRRTAFNLHYREGLDNRRIAQQMKISESTVRVHLSKASKFLRDFMRTHPEMPMWLVLGILT